jgi:hypothetical protein
MDSLFKRYASPFELLDGYISAGRFTEFVRGFIRMNNDEMELKYDWEFYLHRVFDRSFDEYRDEKRINERNSSMPAATVESIVADAQNILNNFNPEKEGGG